MDAESASGMATATRATGTYLDGTGHATTRLRRFIAGRLLEWVLGWLCGRLAGHTAGLLLEWIGAAARFIGLLGTGMHAGLAHEIAMQSRGAGAIGYLLTVLEVLPRTSGGSLNSIALLEVRGGTVGLKQFQDEVQAGQNLMHFVVLPGPSHRIVLVWMLGYASGVGWAVLRR
jgi:hypothetical protein